MKVEWPHWFAVSLPPGWTHEDGEGTIAIFNPNGVGAFTISTARRLRGDSPDADEARHLVLHFAQQRGWNVDMGDIDDFVVNGAPGAHLTYRDSNDHWDLWEAVDMNRLVTMTYVADLQDADTERTDREAIIASFRWL
jgi:hypothetical protein